MKNIEKSIKHDDLERVLERNNQLENENLKLKIEAEELSAKLAWYEEQFRLSVQKKYGSSSEKSDEGEQLCAFNEAEKEARPTLEEPTIEEITYKRSRARKPAGEKFDRLPQEVIEYTLTEEEQICEVCGDPLAKMSTQVRTEVVVIPAVVKLVKHVQNVYSCRMCEKEGIKANIVMARAPAAVIPHSFVSPSLLAFIIDRKYAQALPLYRQEQQWKNFGIELSRQNMANWVIKGAELLNPLYARLKQHLLQEAYLLADETPMQVLTEPGKKAESKSYMWLYCSGEFGRSIFLYEYQASRAGKHPKEFLSGFCGILQTDGYAGYNQVENIINMGCFAHAKRYFVDALKALPKDADASRTLASAGRRYCDKLFLLERTFKGMLPDERLKARNEQSRKVFEEFHEWLINTQEKVLPKSALGKAVSYCLKQWEHLATFLVDGAVELSTNRAERAIKPFVIGRKNYLFSKTPNGALASAICYSIIETAKANGLSPFHYLNYLFETLPNIDIYDTAQVDQLLPWSDQIPSGCHVPSSTL